MNNYIVAEIDLNTVWLTWACPACKKSNHQAIEDIGFGFEMDLTVGEHGSCKPWLEVDCPVCGFHGERFLGITTTPVVVEEEED